MSSPISTVLPSNSAGSPCAKRRHSACRKVTESASTIVPARSTSARPRSCTSRVAPSSVIESPAYRVTTYPGRLSRTSSIESGAANCLDGPAGSPSCRARAVSIGTSASGSTAVVSARATVSGAAGGAIRTIVVSAGGGSAGSCARASEAPSAATAKTTPAPTPRRARRLPTRRATTMPNSYSAMVGTNIITSVSASGGVSRAATTLPTTRAIGRCRANVFGSTSPRAANSTMTSGNSNSIPKAMMVLAAKPKYASAVMMNSRSAYWKLKRIFRIAGSTQRYASTAPATNRPSPAIRIGTM